MRKLIYIFLLLIVSSSLNSQTFERFKSDFSKINIKETLFDSCSFENPSDSMKTIDNKFFSIKYPKDWTIDNDLPQGIDISSMNFLDSLKRGFMLSVIPYRSFYLDKNPKVDYFEFSEGKFDSLDCVFLIRNDLLPIKNSVYWRAEIRIISADNKNIYLLVFGLRSKNDKKPNWCDYKQIINTLKIKG